MFREDGGNGGGGGGDKFTFNIFCGGQPEDMRRDAPKTADIIMATASKCGCEDHRHGNELVVSMLMEPGLAKMLEALFNILALAQALEGAKNPDLRLIIYAYKNGELWLHAEGFVNHSRRETFDAETDGFQWRMQDVDFIYPPLEDKESGWRDHL